MKQLKQDQVWVQNLGCGKGQVRWTVTGTLTHPDGSGRAIVRNENGEARNVNSGGQEDTFTYECYLEEQTQ